ncbi:MULTISPECIES: PTS transporter subunit EIIC [unclassified Enterococcus]|uniref:PTS sugar transporter subunit IIC n=1 Tax=unclassified Enterococcus TaxID=2608891 RepID=UPI00155259AF|nr:MULTISPECIES: PTS transporter subunit EIIC [unclassified Enterococcus]MBS7576899.1 PTS sugar transporter subunit IIC [Enterococcus sp. MMGLQ5-2]MBS7584306.1 PTS sugar transporter subunit IIC [Enterococcus sp. MMGLQ5-1]NPD12162.1 PTS sugar transporter subunit IIC [Enterococcus sp. MMGLQ5-1]NPD36734.1 PTS sugar transporter subunit IIC [Enterococcus sp. MMGLQ5-2]
MKRFMDWLTNSFAPSMNNLFSKPWLAALSSSMQKIIPFILTGSLIYFYNVFVSFFPQLPDLSPIVNFSFGLISLIVAFMMANQCMEKLNHPFYITNAGLAAICVLIMTVIPQGENADSLSAFLGNLGPSGIAVGMVVGLFVSVVFHLWGKLNFMKESSVPDFVTGWINTIIPNLIVLGITMILVNVLKINMFEVILSVFKPVAAIGQTLPGFILICFIPAFFYTMGISSWLFGAVTTPIFMAGIQANIEAVEAGGVAQNIVTSESVFTLAFITMGGMCATLGLNLLMCFSKSKQLKTLGRVFLAPSIFNINEPVMFGAPVVFNPLLMLPAWINSIVGAIYVWVLMSTGLLNIPSKMIQVGQVPAPISSVMVTQDIRAVIWWVILFVIYLVIWYPFFKAFEKEKLAEEIPTV